MSGRITQSMLSQNVLSDLNNVASKLSKTQQKLSSGKQITRPSDDPFGAGRALTLRSDLESINQYKRNVNDAQAVNQATETALSQVSAATQRARELLVQGANGTNDKTGREAIAGEIDQLRETIKQAMNTNYAGRFIFAGSADNAAPYAMGSGSSDAYTGNNTTVYREIGRNVSVPTNTIGSDVVGNGQASGDNKLLAVLADISDHLRSTDPAEIAKLNSGDLGKLDADLDSLSGIRATVGSVTERLDSASSALDQLEELSTDLLSKTEDADMAKTLIDYSTQQSVYQAALKSGANVIQPSLLDFLT